MTLRPETPLHVSLSFDVDEIVPVGRLALDRGRAVLEYSAGFLGSPLTINPRWVRPSRELVWASEPRVFGGLHGVFADSLPDAWGRELIRRRARANGIDPSEMTVLDQLAIVGRRSMAALIYEPELPAARPGDSLDLDALSREAIDLLTGRADDERFTTLVALGESSGGVRPKILVAMSADGTLQGGAGPIPAGSTAWIVKFRAPRDRVDAGPIEAAYADMARAAGIEVAPTMLLPSTRGEPGYFATQRFKRIGCSGRLHVLSVAALLEIAWEIPSIDYHGMMTAVRLVTRHQGDVEQLFHRAVFNVAAHNRDDHAKQHAFVMDRAGTWRLAPAYDLTFSNGPGNEHYLSINGKGADIVRRDLQRLAERQSIGARTCDAIIDEVCQAVGEFDRFAGAYEVTRASRKEIGSVFDRQLVTLRASPRKNKRDSKADR